MRALTWHGKKDVRVENVPDPEITNPRDIILKITTTCICGSDLHLFDGYVQPMKKGDVLGHEFMGEVVEIGSGIKNLKKGDRVAIPFNIACGNCFYCQKGQVSCCDNSNPKPTLTHQMFGYPAAALFGYSHLYGGYAGGQAEYVRVPYGDFAALKIPEGLADEQVIFLTDIFPTGYMAAENCNIQRGDTVAVFGCGPVGQFSIRSAFMLGAEKVIAVDRVPERLQMAREGGADTVDYSKENVFEALAEMTGGRGPDSCIDAVGMEAHGYSLYSKVESMKQAVRMQFDRTHALRLCIECVRKGGTVSVPGVYAGLVDKFPVGVAFGKGLTIKGGQTHTHMYMKPLLERVQKGDIDPTFVITHMLPLEDAAEAYHAFCNKQDECIKVVLKPGMKRNATGNLEADNMARNRNGVHRNGLVAQPG